MAGDYFLKIISTTGNTVAYIDDYFSLTYRKEVNGPGWLRFKLDGEHSKLANLVDKCQVLVMRRDTAAGLDWTEDFCGLLRKVRYSTSERDMFEGDCLGVLHMLSWRVNAFKAGVANRSTYSAKPAETIMWSLVNYNFTANATTGNSRIRNGQLTSPYTISVGTDSARGTTMTRSNSGVNVLEELAEIAGIGSLDFDLVRTSNTSWQFTVYSPVLGSDKSSTVIFAMERGNMSEPTYMYDAADEKTVAIVAGQDEGTKRQTAVRTGQYYSASNDIEVWVDARNEPTSNGLNQSGDKALRARRAKQEFKYTVQQSPSTMLGRDYVLGDLVTGQYQSISVTQKVTAYTINYEKSSGKEDIQVELTDQ